MTNRTDSTSSYSQAYDVENRLISVSKSGGGTTTFAYDANGQRTSTRDPAGTTTYYPFPAYEQSYPVAQNDLFPENATNWNVENGTWNWNASQFYISSSNNNNAVTTHNSATLGSNGVIAASIRANNNKNGYLVFDYQDASNYKYIGLDAQTDKWVFGQRVNNNSDLYIVNETVNNAQWYDVKIVLSGNTAKLYVNGTFKAQYSYSATFSDGKVGFRAVNANSYFDNFLVSTAEVSRTTDTLAGRIIATRVTGDPMTTNNGLFYLFSGHLGSTSVLATSTGNPVPGSKTAYYPFGSPRTTPTQTITDRNFTGQKENMELGLIYYNARYYVPGSGRFLTPDTLIPNPNSSQSFNRYTYTLNNPLKHIDPSGHRTCTQEQVASGDETCNENASNPNNKPPLLSLSESPCTDIWCLPEPLFQEPEPFLQEWEIQLLILVAFYETQGQGADQAEYVAWMILNRYAQGDYDTFEELIMSGQYHISLGNPGVSGSTGIFSYYGTINPPLTGQARANAAYDWYRNEFAGARVSDVIDRRVRGVVNAYNNGATDPTGGSIYFAHASSPAQAEAFVAGLHAEAQRLNQTSQLSVGRVGNLVYNNLYSPPFGQYTLNQIPN